jgi:geranylgeranyl reductase family protein
MHTTDVCIVGAGPGGVTAALHLAGKGIPCTLVDKAQFPRDKVCGDALSGKVVSELKRIDPSLPDKLQGSGIGLPSWGIHFVAPGGGQIQVPFQAKYNPQLDAAPGYIARRLDFDDFLVREARQRPEITLMEGLEIKDFVFSGAGWTLTGGDRKAQIQAKLLIVANGAQSAFSRKQAGLLVDPAHHCAGLRAYYRNVAGCNQENFIELHFLKPFLPGYFWIFPLPGGFANVGVGMLSSHISRNKVNLRQDMLALIATHPALKDRFADAELTGDIRGYGLPLGSRRRRISGAHFMLTGDAAHLIDPFSGEGISNAMISGRWAAEQAQSCIRTGDFSAERMQQYDVRVFNRLGRELQLGYRMQQLLRFPWLFDAVARKAARNPDFASLLSCMFNDLDIRSQLKKPSFYLKLLVNNG